MRSAVADPCVVCGERERRPVLDIGEYTVARCERCGVHTLSPLPSAVQMQEFDDGSAYEIEAVLREDLRARHRATLEAIERWIPPGRLLDAGCGTGTLLEVARERGWNASGVDPSAASVARVREMGFVATEGNIEDLDLAPASMDAVTLMQVLEHVPDPRPLLAACRRVLRPGGALVVATPNPESLLARVKRERFNYWIPPMHVAWYTPGALERLLRASGFAPVLETTWSARARSLHDGADIVAATPLGRHMPFRVRRLAGDIVARAADALGRGSIVEQIALRWEES